MQRADRGPGRRPRRREYVDRKRKKEARAGGLWRLLIMSGINSYHPTLEAAYLDIVRHARTFPSIFLNQLVQVILRNVLDGCDDAFMLRAAELSPPPDADAARGLAGRRRCGNDRRVWREAAVAARHRDARGCKKARRLTTIDKANADTYCGRSDLLPILLHRRRRRPGRGPEVEIGEVITRWVSRLLAMEVAIERSRGELRDVTLTWYVGLDADATRMGDALWALARRSTTPRGRGSSGCIGWISPDAADMVEAVGGRRST